jgi:hypothetical protein
MADGELTLKLDDETAHRLRDAAEAAGLPVGEYAAGLIAEGLEGEDWAEDHRRLDAYRRTGEHIPLEEGLAFFSDEVERRLAQPK